MEQMLKQLFCIGIPNNHPINVIPAWKAPNKIAMNKACFIFVLCTIPLEIEIKHASMASPTAMKNIIRKFIE